MDSDSNHHHAPHGDGSERSEIGALEKELARQKGLYARVAADFHDFRKRTAREADRRATAEKEAFILELLPAVDSLERALAARESASYDLTKIAEKSLTLTGTKRFEPVTTLLDPITSC